MSYRIFALALLIAATGAYAAEGDPPSPWCVTLAEGLPGEAGSATRWSVGSADRMATQPYLAAVDARYEVDLFGPVAQGRLTLGFVNATDEPRQVGIFADRTGGTLHGGAIVDAYAADGQPVEISFGPPAPRAVQRGGKRQIVRDAMSEPTALTLDADARLEVTAGFTARAEFVDGSYRLELPPVVSACFPGLGAGARHVPLAVPTSAVWRVFDEQSDIFVDSPTHPIFANYQGDHTRVELAAPTADTQRALRLDYALADPDEPSLDAFTATGDDGESELVLVLSPPAELPPPDTLRAKEIVFVIDTSGSMRGQKIASVREALVLLLERLGDDDRLNVVEFNSEHTMLFEAPTEARSFTRSSAEGWIEALEADGSTMLMPALEAAVEQTTSDELHRMVMVLTDGRLGDAEAVERFLAEQVESERLFFVGTGEQDRERIERLAAISRGLALFADEPGQLAATLERLFDQVAAPYAWDLELDAGEATVVSIAPSPLPDLYAGRPVTLRLKIEGQLPEVVVVRGTTVDGPATFTLDVAGRELPAMPTLAERPKRTPPRTTVTPNRR